MEWKAFKFVGKNYELDSCDGYYKIIGFLDGYVGNFNYGLEHNVISFQEELKLRGSYQSVSTKFYDYSNMESPSEKNKRRIKRNAEEMTKLKIIIDALKVLKEKENG